MASHSELWSEHLSVMVCVDKDVMDDNFSLVTKEGMSKDVPLHLVIDPRFRSLSHIWCWVTLSKRMTLEYIHKFIDFPLDWAEVSSLNLILTTEYLEKYMDLPWDFTILSMYTCATPALISSNIEKPWLPLRKRNLSAADNSNLTFTDLVLDIPDDDYGFFRVWSRKGGADYNMIKNTIDKNWDFHALCSNNAIACMQLVTEYPDKNWNFELLSIGNYTASSSITRKLVQFAIDRPDLPFVPDFISVIAPIDIVQSNPQYKWNMYNRCIYIPEVTHCKWNFRIKACVVIQRAWKKVMKKRIRSAEIIQYGAVRSMYDPNYRMCKRRMLCKAVEHGTL